MERRGPGYRRSVRFQLAKSFSNLLLPKVFRTGVTDGVARGSESDGATAFGFSLD